MNLISHGAEAKIYDDGQYIIKERISKSYRIPEIDNKIILLRTRKEIKILQKLEQLGINAPRFIRQEQNKIFMEKISGRPIKELLNDENQREILREVGAIVAKMHNSDIVHGDLTTMNFMMNSKVFVIDFGLSITSKKDEDKAVDLYVFEKALKCVHTEKYEESFYEGYRMHGKESVLKRLEEVRLRGRKREEA